MKAGIIAILAVLFVTVAAADQHPASKTQNSEEERLLAVEQSWMKAEVEHDQATLTRVLDASFVAAVASAKPLDKTAFIVEVMRLTFASQTAAHDVVHVYGGAAVIVGVVTAFPSDRSQKPQTFRYTTMYLKQHGKWVAIAEQLRLLVDVSGPSTPSK